MRVHSQSFVLKRFITSSSFEGRLRYVGELTENAVAYIRIHKYTSLSLRWLILVNELTSVVDVLLLGEKKA